MTFFPRTLGLSENIVNLSDFGAVGDGVTDDTAAIQAWALALGDATINNPLIGVARGYFRFSDEIEIKPSGVNGTVHLDLDGASFIYAGSPGVASTETFTFNNAARTITRASGSFISDGFTPNRWIEVDGSADNDERFYVLSVTASTVTVDDDIFNNSPLTDETISCTIRDRNVLIRFGDGFNENKWFYSSIRGLYLGQVSNISNITGIEIDHADFLEINSMTLAIGGGVASGSRCIDVSGFSKQGNGSANSVTISAINTVGAEDGIMVDQSNVFTVRGGRIQQHTNGFRVRRSAVVQLHTVDFSLNSENACLLEAVGSGEFHNVYAEGNGPGTRGNEAKLFYLQNSRGISFAGCNFNAANGAISDGTHCGYGLYFEDCEGVHISGSYFNLAQRALVYCNANCKDIVLDRSVYFDLGLGWSSDAFQPVTDDSGRLVNRSKARALTPLPSGLTDLISSPDVSDDGYWTYENSASIIGSTLNEERTALVPTVSLPNNSGTPSRLRTEIGTLDNTKNKTLYFRVKLKLIDFQEPDPANRSTDLAAIRLLVYDSLGNNRASNLIRIGREWDWYEYSVSDETFFAENTITYNLRIEVRQAQEPIDIAVEDVEAFFYQDDYSFSLPSEVSNLYGWYDAAEGVEEAAADPAEDGDTVEFWRDQAGSGYDLTQTTPGDRPLFDSVSAFNGLPEIYFNGSTGELSSDDAASVWNFLHDGTGCTMFLAFRNEDGFFVLDTCNASQNNNGLVMDRQGDDMRVRISNGSGTFLSLTQSNTDKYLSTGSILTLRHGSALSPNVELRANGKVTASNDYTGSPSSGDANNSLVLGNRQSSDLPWQGGISELIFYNRLLSDVEMDRVENYLRNKYGFL